MMSCDHSQVQDSKIIHNSKVSVQLFHSNPGSTSESLLTRRSSFRRVNSQLKNPNWKENNGNKVLTNESIKEDLNEDTVDTLPEQSIQKCFETNNDTCVGCKTVKEIRPSKIVDHRDHTLFNNGDFDETNKDLQNNSFVQPLITIQKSPDLSKSGTLDKTETVYSTRKSNDSILHSNGRLAIFPKSNKQNSASYNNINIKNKDISGPGTNSSKGPSQLLLCQHGCNNCNDSIQPTSQKDPNAFNLRATAASNIVRWKRICRYIVFLFNSVKQKTLK